MANFVPRVLRRHSAVGLTARKRAELALLARRSAHARNHYAREYWPVRYAAAILVSPRRLAADQPGSRWPGNGLGAHQNRLALAAALAAIRGQWRRAQENVSRKVGFGITYSPAERHWLRRVVRRPVLLQTCLDGQVPHIPEPWAAGLDERRLSRELRRMVLRERGTTPTFRKDDWLTLDTNSYRAFERQRDHFRGAWLAIAGTRPGRRICVPLAGVGIAEFAPRTSQTNSRPGLLVRVGARVEFCVLQRIPAPSRPKGTAEVGVDIGYRTLLTVSRGNTYDAQSFGESSDELFAAVVDGELSRTKNRRRLAAYARSVRNSESAKAARIKRHCLGSDKARRRRAADLRSLRNAAGRAVNLMFRSNPDVATIYVEMVHFGHSRGGRMSRRYIGRWTSGYLRERLKYASQLHGVQLKAVNAAFTSLTCPLCWFSSKSNRQRDRFTCGRCDYAGPADAVAATNILRRGDDREITVWTRRERVRSVLEERWRSALTCGAWGSSRDLDEGRESREQPRSARATDDVARSAPGLVTVDPGYSQTHNVARQA